MSLCQCGHDFTDHRQTDAEYLCVLCSRCDGYTKAAANISATAPVPAGGTPEGLAGEKVDDPPSPRQPPEPPHEWACLNCGANVTIQCTRPPAAQERPSIDAERWMADAANELQRLVLIIEGTGDARLQAPHGQTSNRPRALLEQYARLSSPEPVEPGE
jgi:hypothetical protein